MSEETVQEPQQGENGPVSMTGLARSLYGKYFDHLSPALSGYQSVFVMSNLDILDIHEIGKNKNFSDREILEQMKRVYPDQAASIDKLDPESAAAAGKLFRLIAEANSVTNPGAFAISAQFGTKDAPVNLAFVFVPEKIEVDLGDGLDPLSKRPMSRDAKSAFVIAHEIGHLVSDLRAGKPKITFETMKEIEQDSVKPMTEEQKLPMEIESDRFAKDAMVSMRAAGLIQDDTIEKDVKSRRNIDAYRTMIEKGSIVPQDLGEEGFSPLQVQSAVDSHATGYSIDKDNDPRAEFRRIEHSAVPILEARERALSRAFFAAITGQSPIPEHNQAASVMLAAANGEIETVETEFKQALSKNPDFQEQLAREMVEDPWIPDDARGVATDYLDAIRHYAEKQKAAAEPPRPEAEAEPEPEAEESDHHGHSHGTTVSRVSGGMRP